MVCIFQNDICRGNFKLGRENAHPTQQVIHLRIRQQAVVSGDRVDVSGQVGVTPELSVPDDITEQADQAFTNLRNVLEAAGSSLANVTQLTMYYTDIGDSQAVDKVFTKFFPERYPARTAVQVVSLVLAQLKLEIQASAVLDD